MGVKPVQSCVFGKVAVVVEIHSRMISVFIGCAAAHPRNMIIESDILCEWKNLRIWWDGWYINIQSNRLYVKVRCRKKNSFTLPFCLLVWSAFLTLSIVSTNALNCVILSICLLSLLSLRAWLTIASNWDQSLPDSPAFWVMFSQLSGGFLLGLGDSFLSKSRSHSLGFDFFGLVSICLGTVLRAVEMSSGGVSVKFPSLLFSVGLSGKFAF